MMRYFWTLWIVLLIGVHASPVSPSSSEVKEVTLRGRVICVDQTGEKIECTDENNRYALRTHEGQDFYFLESDTKSAMFDDPRVRARELEVTAWLNQEGLEIIKIYSIRDGQLYDIHYFCELCQIKAYVGGPCWCCQKEFELVEEPVSRE